MKSFFIKIITVFAVFSTSAFAYNKQLDPQFLCLVASNYYEKKYSIPEGLLKSISIVESGRWNKEHKLALAWPWSINIDGEGKYFNSYEEAANFLRRAIKKSNNLDIGCHQVNWRNHGQYFDKPEDLLNPQKNAAYAAYFLVQKFQKVKDWNKAIAHYHSQVPIFGSEYLKKFHKVFSQVKADNLKYNNFLQRKRPDTLPVRQINARKNRQIAERLPTRFNTNIMVFSQEVELPSNSVILD
jgi:hypothetical protein